MEIQENAVYTPKEVIALLKISSSTLKRMLKGGLIHANKIGGQYRFLGREVLRVVSPSLEEKAVDTYRIVKSKTKEITESW